MERIMRTCDAVILNLTPFRGPSADVGSAYEMGFMRALGRPIFAYSNDDRSFIASRSSGPPSLMAGAIHMASGSDRSRGSWTLPGIAFNDSPETLDFAGPRPLPSLHLLDFTGRTGLYRAAIRRAV
jgi:hypothetical protein